MEITPMNQIITDLFGHQAWADAEILRAIGGHSVAKEDKIIRKRLNHIHQAQRAFLQIAQGVALDRKNLAEIDEWDELLSSFIHYHENALIIIQNITEAALKEVAAIPWFKDPPLRITIRELLLQTVMHTHQHRAQNITRLRELGGEPPIIDLIMWYWKKRPKANWEQEWI
jgi:uncharacterized damage-inducible protein DinB